MALNKPHAGLQENFLEAIEIRQSNQSPNATQSNFNNPQTYDPYRVNYDNREKYNDDELLSAVTQTIDGEKKADMSINFPIIQSPSNAIMSRTIQKDALDKTKPKLYPFPSKNVGFESQQEVMSAATKLVQPPN